MFTTGDCSECGSSGSKVYFIKDTAGSDRWLCQGCLMERVACIDEPVIVQGASEGQVCSNCGDEAVGSQCDDCASTCGNCGSYGEDRRCTSCESTAACESCGTQHDLWCSDCHNEWAHDNCHDECHSDYDCENENETGCSDCGDVGITVLCAPCRKEAKTESTVTQTGTIEYDDGMVIQLIE